MSSKKNKPTLPGLVPTPKKNELERNDELFRQELAKGRVINASDLESGEVLGKGQYGIVRKVLYKPTNTMLAMKEIPLSEDARVLHELIQEISVLRENRSPYIVQFYGSFIKDTSVFYCMELMDYGSLEVLYKKGPVPEPAFGMIAFSTVKGLKYMKDELKFIHRDVKPTNILINSKGDIKLCDFGISGKLVQSVAQTYVGSTSYMAPERINNTTTNSNYDIRSDVWSLGITLVEVGNSKYPYAFDSGQIFALLRLIVEGPAPQLNARYSAEAMNFVAKCLQKNRDERPTYSQLLEDPWIKRFETSPYDVGAWLLSRGSTSSSTSSS